MPEERRRYFRVDDTVTLHAELVEPADLQKKLDDFWSNRNQYLARHTRNQRVDEQLSDLMAIREKMPELARYLGVMQDQIDHLSKIVLPEQVDHRDNVTNVNLSAQGISYPSDQKLKPVDMLELILTLHPSGHKLIIFARVVLVEDNEDDFEEGNYRISLDFEHIHETDREILIKHVHGKQLQSLGPSKIRSLINK